MNAAVRNLVFSLVAMQLARKVPFDNPEVLNYVRIGYVTVQLLVLSTYYFISMRIKQNNDQTVLKYVEPGNPMTQQQGELVATTVRDYDLGEVSKLVRSVYMGVAMMGFLHVYMNYTQPLFIQGIMGIKNLYEAKLVQIYILGKPAEGDLKRPFKASGGMFGAAAGEPATDKAAIDEAEKKAGSKKDD